jgi:hypothetical protein
MSVETNYTFTNSSNYTFDVDEIQVAAGQQELKDRRPPNSTFYANYSTINGNWGEGVLTGTPTGGAGVIAGRLFLALGTVRYVDYDANLNADSQQVGCVRINEVRPNYNGIPATTQNFLTISKAHGDNDNAVWIKHLSGTGNLNTQIRDATGGIIASITWGAWSPVSGTPYDIELNWDITTGATRLFINGVQFGATNVATGTRDANIGLFRIGSDINGADTSNFTMEGILIFSTVQHTSNYTPDWSDIPATIYNITNPTTTYNAIIRMDGLCSITETAVKTGSDEIKYILRKNGVSYYHNGSAWTTSNGTYAQSNTITEINTNATTFTTVPVNVQILDLKHSDDGSTTPTLSNVKITYDFAGSEPTLTEAIIWGWYFDIAGVALNTKTIKVQVTRWLYGTKTVIDDDYVNATITDEGYFEVTLKYEDDIPAELKWMFDDNTIITNFRAGISRFKQLMRT